MTCQFLSRLKTSDNVATKGEMTLNEAQVYPIGTPGEKWGEPEKAAWLAEQSIRRSYAIEVVAKLDKLKEWFDIGSKDDLEKAAEHYS